MPELRVSVNGKVTPRPRSWPGWKNRPWSARLFGAAIWQDSTQGHFLDWWTSSLRGCHASPTPALAVRPETPTIEVSAKTATDPSHNSCGSSPSVAPPWSSSKTSQLGFDLLTNGFDQSATNYAEWVTRSLNRSLSLRQMLARATSENACSSWQSPRANEAVGSSYQNQRDGSVIQTLTGEAANGPSPRSEDSESCGNHPGATDSLTGATSKWPTPRAFDFKGGGENTPENHYLDRTAEKWTTPQAHYVTERGSGQQPTSAAGNACLARDARMWGTPRASEAKCGGGYTDEMTGKDLSKDVTKWQTPNARDNEGSGMKGQDRSDEMKLAGQAKTFSPPDQPPTSGDASSPNLPTLRRRLSPAFAAWLMGWNWFWTNPEPINFAASVTASYRFKLRSRLSNFFAASKKQIDQTKAEA